MKKLQCELCGSIDILRTDDGFFQCQHCGCKYTLEQARTILSGTIEIVKGQAELKQKLDNAETQKKLGEYAKMLKIYNSLTYDFPGELIVWESLLNSIYYLFSHVNQFSLTHEPNLLENLQQYYANAINTCQTATDKNRIKQKYEQFCNDFISMIISGEFDIIESFVYYGFMHERFKKFIETFPGATTILDVSSRNVTTIKQDGIYPTKDGHWRVNRKGTYQEVVPLYLIGTTLLWRTTGREPFEYRHKLLEPFKIEHIARYKSEAQTAWNTMTQCPSCNRALTGFGKRTCKNCRNTYYKI